MVAAAAVQTSAPRVAAEREVRFALAIPHTPWKPERVASLKRLVEQLDAGGGYRNLEHQEESGERAFRIFSDREPPHVWIEKILRFGLELAERDGVTHLVQLQDDVVVAPNFWPAARAMVQARPTEILALETAHPIAPAYASRDDESVRFITTTEGLIGVGWILPVETIRAFLAWRDTKLVAGAAEKMTEDTLMGIFAMATKTPILHPIPTIIDHDVALASTYGNDAHANRRPTVLWSDGPKFAHHWDESDLESPGFWQGLYRRVQDTDLEGRPVPGQYVRAQSMDLQAVEHSVRHVGRFYGNNIVDLASKIVLGWTPADTMRALADTGEREKRRMAAARRAHVLSKPARERVLICSPRRGGVHPEYGATCDRLIRLVEVDVHGAWEILDVLRWHEDVVRVRSRFLQAARGTDCTSVHFLDTDVSAEPSALLGMLASGHLIVGAPYPRREGIDFERVLRGGWEHPEARAYAYPLGLMPDLKKIEFDAHDCTEVMWIPLGCSVIRRQAFEAMIDHYAELDEQRVDLSIDPDALSRVSHRKLEQMLREAYGEIERWRAGHMGLKYVDRLNNAEIPAVAVFQLLVRQERLWGEDQSFCLRARDMGIPVHAYMGLGSPVTHHGEHAFRGHLEAFGLSREAPAVVDARRRAAQGPPKCARCSAPAEAGKTCPACGFTPGFDDAADEAKDDEPAVP